MRPLVPRVQNTSVSLINEEDPFSAEVTGRFADEDLCDNQICSCQDKTAIMCTCTESFPELNLREGHHLPPSPEVTTVFRTPFLITVTCQYYVLAIGFWLSDFEVAEHIWR